MREYAQKRVRYVSRIEDIQKIIDIASRMTVLIHIDADKRSLTLKDASYVEDKQRYLNVTTRYVKDFEDKDGNVSYEFDTNYPCTWKFDKTGAENYHMHPSRVSRLSNNVYKPMDYVKEGYFELDSDGRPYNSAKPILGFNPKYDKTEHQVYCYDLNSAYAMVLRDKIIDTYHPHFHTMVKDNQVGFMDDTDITMVHRGMADVVFDLIDSPYRDFCDKWYNIKKKAPKGSREKAEAKDVLVITVGLFQLHNPFLRAYVVNSCNEFIQSIIDRHPNEICMYNTDAVYSTIPLDDLVIGDNVGQFKLEYQGLFRQVGNNYQKVDIDETSYRGVCKIMFKEGYNILNGDIPRGLMPYTYDKQSHKVIDNTIKEI